MKNEITFACELSKLAILEKEKFFIKTCSISKMVVEPFSDFAIVKIGSNCNKDIPELDKLCTEFQF